MDGPLINQSNRVVLSSYTINSRSPPVISYKYSNAVAAKILNFSATVRNIDIDDFIKSPQSCDCASSPYRYASHGHVITRDFGIIPNEDLKRLHLKGPTNRKQTSISWRYNIRAKKESKKYECLRDWVQHVKQIVRSKVNSLRKTVESKL